MKSPVCKAFDLSRGTTHDGPGIRTTVFLKGCPLKCLWCQNPEGISRENQISWDREKCIGCFACISACRRGAVSKGRQGVIHDQNLCSLCGRCVDTCPSCAIEFTAREWTLEEVVQEVLKDREYYASFGGGVTVSGGEPMSQPEFVAAFFTRLQEYDIHTALDTCGMAPKEFFYQVLQNTNHVLFDLKMLDCRLHEKYTGRSNDIILQNLIDVGDIIRRSLPGTQTYPEKVTKLWIRTPLIPGITADSVNIYGIGKFITNHLADITERWELCAFNNACSSKYDKLGSQWALKNHRLMDRKKVEKLKTVAASTGFEKAKIVVSGLIAQGNNQPD